MDKFRVALSTNDYLIIIAYFVSVLVIGFKTKTESNSIKDYLVAGRSLTLPAFVASLVSTFYGGVLGIGEFTYRFGLAGWFLYAFPYYIFVILFALYLSDRVRKAHLYTIPDKLNRVYGKKVGILGGFFVFLMSTPAPYLFIMGILISLVFSVKLLTAMVFALLVSVLYLIKGGLRADVRVNMFEFVMMFVGFGIILPFCFNTLGGFEYLDSRLPEADLSLLGNSTLQYFLVWFFLGSWVLVDPSFHQRCYAAKRKSTPKIGILISLGFWILFDFLTTTAGLYSKAFFLNDLKDPILSFPAIAEKVLPPIAKGVFYVGMIATVMSSLHSYIFISATTFGRDILSRIKNQDDYNNTFNKIGLLISAVLSLFLAYTIPSVVNIWYTVGTLVVPALLIGVVSAYFDKLRVESKYIFLAMISSFFVSLISFVLGSLHKDSVYPLGLEPMYPGLIIGMIIYLFGYSQKSKMRTEQD
ncbi:MAG: sodium:solute symporter family protein [Ignavibacteria bacterium]|nr:sodium:solute symporter family protein [Ignavibacteria bacterium]MBK9227607.1 sodium:solute symporter family protein [Ignavibacteria bacterium]